MGALPGCMVHCQQHRLLLGSWMQAVTPVEVDGVPLGAAEGGPLPPLSKRGQGP
jgi:hypothetical protein